MKKGMLIMRDSKDFKSIANEVKDIKSNLDVLMNADRETLEELVCHLKQNNLYERLMKNLDNIIDGFEKIEEYIQELKNEDEK